jgi:hypothetical protein
MKISQDLTKLLKDLNIPSRDIYGLPTSEKRFPDGSHFRTEECLKTAEEYEEMFFMAEKYGFVVNRITDVKGIMWDTDDEILRKCELARRYGCEVLMAPGPGGEHFDIGKQVHSGMAIEGKLRGMDLVIGTIQDMLRSVELGCRAFLMHDEGVLYIALAMRKTGQLPPEMKFKLSAHFSISNPAATLFWLASLEPQDEINPARDLTLPMISGIRAVTDNALDIHIHVRNKISRTMEAPEIVRVGAPISLKNASMKPHFTMKDRCMRTSQVVETIKKYYPEAKQSEPGAEGLNIPVKPDTKW